MDRNHHAVFFLERWQALFAFTASRQVFCISRPRFSELQDRMLSIRIFNLRPLLN